jgi:hypothetical protein
MPNAVNSTKIALKAEIWNIVNGEVYIEAVAQQAHNDDGATTKAGDEFFYYSVIQRCTRNFSNAMKALFSELCTAISQDSRLNMDACSPG